MLMNNSYLVTAKDEEVINEIAECEGCINWFNFDNGDIYYNNNGEPYRVIINHDDKNVRLIRM